MSSELEVQAQPRIWIPNQPRPEGKRVVWFELWGVSDDLLHGEDKLTEAFDRVMILLNLHPVGKPDTQPYEDLIKKTFGLSYRQFLGQSLLTAHTYKEENNHLDGEVSICSPKTNLDTLDRVLFDEFKPQDGGWVHEPTYPPLEVLNRLAKERGPFQPITTSGIYVSRPIPPFRS